MAKRDRPQVSFEVTDQLKRELNSRLGRNDLTAKQLFTRLIDAWLAGDTYLGDVGDGKVPVQNRPISGKPALDSPIKQEYALSKELAGLTEEHLGFVESFIEMLKAPDTHVAPSAILLVKGWRDTHAAAKKAAAKGRSDKREQGGRRSA